jgi:uncharacterized protein YecE (DUF72 family)
VAGLSGADGRHTTGSSPVGVQQTLYKLPKPETIHRWRDEEPSGFVFCMKAWQRVTHLSTSPMW